MSQNTPFDLIERQRKDPSFRLNKVFDFKQAQGMPYLHSDGNQYHFQCRPIDMTNWGNLLTNLSIMKDTYIAAGLEIDMMTEEDIGIKVDTNTCISILLQIQQFYNLLYSVRWDVKEEIKLLTTRELRESYDVLGRFDAILNTKLQS